MSKDTSIFSSTQDEIQHLNIRIKDVRIIELKGSIANNRGTNWEWRNYEIDWSKEGSGTHSVRPKSSINFYWDTQF